MSRCTLVRTSGISAEYRAALDEAAATGTVPAAVAVGTRLPAPCRPGRPRRRHDWVAREDMHLCMTARTPIEGLVHDWRQCAECGLVRIEITDLWGQGPDVVWMTAAEWSIWTDAARGAAMARGCCGE